MITPTVAGSVSRTPSITNRLNSTSPVADSATSPSSSRGRRRGRRPRATASSARPASAVAQGLARGERVALDEVRRGHQRADQRERGGGQQGSAQRRAHRAQRMLQLVRWEGPVQPLCDRTSSTRVLVDLRCASAAAPSRCAPSSRSSCATRCAPAGSRPASRCPPRARSRASSASRAAWSSTPTPSSPRRATWSRARARPRASRRRPRPRPARAPRPAAERPPRFDFRPGGPDVSLFPRAAWLASLRRALRDAPDARLRLRRPARRARAARRACRATSAASAAWPRPRARGRHLRDGPGHGAARPRAGRRRARRRIGVEDPSSAPGREQLAANGLEIVPVPVDADGLRVDVLEALGAGRGLCRAGPPVPARRGARAGAARRADRLGRPYAARSCSRTTTTPSTATTARRSAPCRASRPSWSCTRDRSARRWRPGLRLGWLVVPERLAEAVVAAKATDDLGTPVVEQLALADFLERGELDRHLRRTRSSTAPAATRSWRRSRASFPDCPPAGVAAGLHLVVHLPRRRRRARRARAGALARGRPVRASPSTAIEPGPPALLLGYGRIAEPAIDAGVAELAAAVRYAA